MANRTVRINFKYNGVLADATAATLSDQTAAYGIKRNDTDAVVVAAGTAMTKVGTGQYEYTFAEPAVGLSYTAWVKFVYGGNTYYNEVDVEGTATADESAMTVSMAAQTGSSVTRPKGHDLLPRH